MESSSTFAVNQFTTMPLRFEEDLALYQMVGVESVEVCEQKFSRDRAKAADQLAKLCDMGFAVTSIQPRVHALFPDRMAKEPTDPEDRIAQFRKTIDLFASKLVEAPVSRGAGRANPFSGPIPLVAIGGAAPEYNYREAGRVARKVYPELAAYAADHGVRIAFEPIHPVMMNTDNFICTLKGALELIEDVDHPSFGLVCDLWHLWQEPDILNRIASVIDRVFVVHVSDWLAGGPRRLDDRGIPGTGEIDLPAWGAMFRDAGYTGPYCLEILSDKALPDSLWQADPRQVIEESRQGFERAWEA